MIVALEGNVGAGKSTLAARLASTDGTRVVLEQTGARLQTMFYEDPGRYGFALQLAMRAERAGELAHAFATGAPTVLDRSVIGDYAFAAWNAACGNLAAADFAAYRERAGSSVVAAVRRARALFSSADAAEPLVVVWLCASDAQLAENRRARGSADESNVDDAYFAGVEAAHALAMTHVALDASDIATLVVLEWREYRSIGDALDFERVVGERAKCVRAFTSTERDEWLDALAADATRALDAIDDARVRRALCSAFVDDHAHLARLLARAARRRSS